MKYDSEKSLSFCYDTLKYNLNDIKMYGIPLNYIIF